MFIKAIRGAKCDLKGCKKTAKYWSAFKIAVWEPGATKESEPRVLYRCVDHCDPNKWFSLEEEDYT